MRCRRGLLACAVTVLAAGCDRGWAPSVDACAQILATRIPAARVVAAASAAGADAELDFEVGTWWKVEQRGHLACSFEEQDGGGLRLRTAAIDGQPFTSAEVTVVNADLLLADMRRTVEQGAE